MRVPIKMIVENAQKGDQVEYSGVIKKVYEFKDKPTKWSIGNQTMIIADKTGEINTIVNIRTDRGIYGPEHEGKEVVVSGTASEWEGKKNVFGKKISFTENWQEEDRPEKQKNTSGKTEKKSDSQQVFATHNITPEQIRIECLKISLQHISIIEKADNGDMPDTKEIIGNAKLFEKYVTGNKIEGAVNTTEEVLNKAKSLFKGKMEEFDEDLPEKVKKINDIMELADESGDEGRNYVDDFVKKCGQDDIKKLTLKQLETLGNKVKSIPPSEENIPF